MAKQLIDRGELMKIITKMDQHVYTTLESSPKSRYGIDKFEVEHAILSLPLEPQQEWIPVEEKLPESWWEYVVTRESGVVSTLEYDSQWWHWEWQEPMYGSRPIYWQPLPLAPQ